jgi:anti-sigma factor RsiW
VIEMNDLNLKECVFAEDIVSYMYGELSAPASFAFESHLAECGECTDGFAEVSSARFEVYDWKKLEFDGLPTPSFVIPSSQSEPAMSWIEKVRAAFANSWATQGLAFGGVLFAAVLGGLVFFGGGDSGITTVSTEPTPVTSSPVVVPVPSPVTIPDVVASNGSATSSSEQAPRSVQVKTTVRGSSNRRPTRRTDTIRPITAQRTVTIDDRAPRLNEFNDDEDTSLRLAQLFDDIDTRD